MKNLTNISIPVELKQVISSDMAYHYKIIPLSQSEDCLEFYIDKNNSKDDIVEELELYMGKRIKLIEVEEEILNKALFEYYRKSKSDISTGTSNSNVNGSGFLESLIYESKSIGSSDIHFEVYENEARVRLRIDGQLIEKYKIPKENYLELVNKIKIESNLDITEKRLPQDGRINFKDFDIRVSILPTLHGEKIVMRILGKDTSHISIEKVGFDTSQIKHYFDAIKKTNGIVLISGPTGSGKTTTLYASLKFLNDSKRNIVTVEDPIEYTLEGINQVQLKEDIGLTFSSTLRSFLRQDPDIIMLGEIRDVETAQMAIRASLTGHLVLSTIHTNSALGTISRLIDMGIPAFYIAETLNISVAQRLLRKLCNSCKEKTEFNIKDFPYGYKPPREIRTYFKQKGCQECYYTGYKGRQAIYETIPINEDMVGRIKNDYQNLEKEYKYDTLSKKAFDLLYNGETSLEEIYSLLINN